MKTIFLTIFEGVEAKNILRTAIVSTLLSNPDVRLVLLMKNQARVERYRQEFFNPRIHYEVVQRSDLRGIDRLFAALKFVLLRTETTDLRRRMMYDLEDGLTRYYGGITLNRMLARPRVRRLVRWLDERIVSDRTYASLFDRFQPDLVFCAHLFDEPEAHLLREAKRRGVRSIGFINSWDKVTARCILRLLPDYAIVFNHIVKRELVEHDEMDPQSIFVGGIPQYDHYVNEPAGTREEFFRTVGIAPEKKIILYATEGRAFSASDWDMIDLMRDMNAQGAFGSNAEILVRFQPNDFMDEQEIAKRPYLHYQYPGIRFSSKRGVDWDMDANDLNLLRVTLTHVSLLVCYTSSIVVDAAMFDIPIINIDFEIKKAPLAKSPTQFFQMTHYRNVLATGGIHVVKSREELAEWVRRYLTDPAFNHEGRERLVREQCVFTDGRAGERIGKFILEKMHRGQ